MKILSEKFIDGESKNKRKVLPNYKNEFYSDINNSLILDFNSEYIFMVMDNDHS